MIKGDPTRTKFGPQNSALSFFNVYLHPDFSGRRLALRELLVPPKDGNHSVHNTYLG